jgi:hypothetical protein
MVILQQVQSGEAANSDAFEQLRLISVSHFARGQ